MAGTGVRRVPALFTRVGIEAWILEPELNTVEITRRAQHVLSMPLCDVPTLQRVQTHGAVARDASVP